MWAGLVGVPQAPGVPGNRGVEHGRRDILDGRRQHPGRRTGRGTGAGRVDDDHVEAAPRGLERDREPGDAATEHEEIRG